MKIFEAIFLVALITGHTKADYIIDGLNEIVSQAAGDRLKEVIEKCKEILRYGNETLEIPVMDPYKSDPVKLFFDSDKIKGKLNVVSADILGISDYKVNKAEFKMVGLKMSLGFQWSKLKGDVNAYKLNGILLNLIDIYGKGDAEFTLRDLNFAIDLSFSINATTKKLFIKSTETQLSLGSLQFYSEGFYNDRDISQIFSAIISDMTPKFIETYQKELTDAISGNLMAIANHFLSTKTLKDLLELIS